MPNDHLGKLVLEHPLELRSTNPALFYDGKGCMCIQVAFSVSSRAVSLLHTRTELIASGNSDYYQQKQLPDARGNTSSLCYEVEDILLVGAVLHREEL